MSPWAVSFDVHLGPRASLTIALGSTILRMSRGDGGDAGVRLVAAGRSSLLGERPGWPHRVGWRHVEVASARSTRLAVDGREFVLSRSRGSSLVFRVWRGRAQLNALLVSPLADRGALLLHRLAELHARVPVARFPEGADRADNIHYDSTWMSGFWAGALWQAAALEPAAGMFGRWALSATVRHFGRERSDTHDVGFMYGESSLPAWQALCRGSTSRGHRRSLCMVLRGSVLRAAQELVALAAGNPGAGTIPVNSTDPVADTIVDSSMNIGILPWATRETGDQAYARLALHQARAVASLLVRPDGSTAQAVYFNRRTGRVLSVGTHQGLSDTSTWSRGQAWAVYGFAQAAAQLRNRGLLRVAERLSAYVAGHLPPDLIPRWDDDAPAGAPVDVSAGVITAAGLTHLVSACSQLAGVCSDVERWRALGRRMLWAALGRASRVPPLGLLRSQVLNKRGHGCWCNGSELIFGLTYALEALRLTGGGRSG